MLRGILPLLPRPSAPPPTAKWPAAANENIPLIGKNDDPRAVLIVMREVLAEWRQATARDARLVRCPEARRRCNDTRALEQAIPWKYFRRRENK
jgi:hypothetical protein